MSSNSASGSTRRRGLLHYILDRRSASVYGLALLGGVGVLGALQIVPNLPLALVAAAVVAYEFQKRLDQGVPLLQLTGLIAVLQWLVGPALAYTSGYEYGRYQMYVDEYEYFAYALPATCAYVVVMLAVGASIRQRELLENIDRSNFVKIGFFLNLVAFVASIALTRVGSGWFFFFALVTQARYVAAIYFLFSRHELRLLFAAGSLSFLLIGSLSVGMFHDLLLWLAVIFCYWFAQRKWTLQAKFSSLALTGLLLFGIQVVKADYRKQLRMGEQPSLSSMMLNYLTPGGKGWEEGAVANAIVRLNQGWIISAIMFNVPAEEPFAEGETLKDAFISAFFPRFLAPDKKQAGGRENFTRFTGLELNNETSMGISPLGEAYANFGPFGGIFLMMGFGALFAVLFKFSLKFIVRRPAFFFWIPMIFYQSIKAETELVVVLNAISKGFVVAVALYYITDFNFPVRMRRFVYQTPASPLPVGRRPSRLRPSTLTTSARPQ
jgi:hypothetical protein